MDTEVGATETCYPVLRTISPSSFLPSFTPSCCRSKGKLDPGNRVHRMLEAGALDVTSGQSTTPWAFRASLPVPGRHPEPSSRATSGPEPLQSLLRRRRRVRHALRAQAPWSAEANEKNSPAPLEGSADGGDPRGGDPAVARAQSSERDGLASAPAQLGSGWGSSRPRARALAPWAAGRASGRRGQAAGGRASRRRRRRP